MQRVCVVVEFVFTGVHWRRRVRIEHARFDEVVGYRTHTVHHSGHQQSLVVVAAVGRLLVGDGRECAVAASTKHVRRECCTWCVVTYECITCSPVARTQYTHEPWYAHMDLRDHDSCIEACARRNGRAYIDQLTQLILHHYRANVQDERTRAHKMIVRKTLLNVVRQVCTRSLSACEPVRRRCAPTTCF